MSKHIKVGDTVITRTGRTGVVVARYREPLGHYFLYEVSTESGIIITRYVKHD